MALAFDCHVQNGRSRRQAVARLAPQAGRLPEPEMRLRLAQEVAQRSAPRWRSDVLGRKRVLATGSARFRGRDYTLAHWGLDESDAA